jgi:hypothetical protein
MLEYIYEASIRIGLYTILYSMSSSSVYFYIEMAVGDARAEMADMSTCSDQGGAPGWGGGVGLL